MVTETSTATELGLIDDWDIDLNFSMPMGHTEHRFKNAVYVLVMHGKYPSPTTINKLLGRDPRSRKMNNLNDRECRWRREICKEIGFTLRGKNL